MYDRTTFFALLTAALLVFSACGESGDDTENNHQNVDQNDNNTAQNVEKNFDPNGDELPPDDLVFVDQPPEEVTAGAPFDVAVELVDEQQHTVERENVEVTLTLSNSQFADGTDETTEVTNSSGLAEFELVIEQAFSGLVLTAAVGADDFAALSTNSELFDVIAKTAYAEHSSIHGESGVAADGEQQAAVTIELFDAFDNPVSGVTPDFTASGEGNEYDSCSETDDSGVATCSMTSTEPGEKTLEITDPVEVTGDTVLFTLPCDTAGAPFGGGDGSSDDPYRICTPHQLNTIGTSRDYLDEAYVLAADIDLGGIDDFNIIGYAEDLPVTDDWFSGQFDGRGHVIEHFTLDGEFETPVGLFGVIDSSAVIEDVGVVDVDIDIQGAYVGGLVGLNYGEVSNCYSSGDIEAGGSTGGLVGRHYEGLIVDSHSGATVVGNFLATGGLVGEVNSGEIHNSYATGDVDGEERVGGLAGSSGRLITNSYATGDVNSDVWNAGGLVGVNDGEITKSYATGDVYGHERVGGLVGTSFSDTDISESYSTGSATAEDYVGGSVGRNYGTILHTYWDEERSGLSAAVGDGSDDGIAGLSTTDFEVEDNFDGWDFSDTWAIGLAPDGETRPIFEWQ